MRQFIYPDEHTFFVTEETVKKTENSFHPTNGIWEPLSIHYFYTLVNKKHENKNAVIVDVGAQSGLYSLYAKFLPSCRFYAFEPFQDTYTLLQENLQLNQIYNVKTYNYALGSKNETKILHVPDHLGLNTLGDIPKRFDTWKDVLVQVKRLDDIFLEEKESSLDYLKCDTEGWEYHVLKGAEECIRKWKPELFIEVNGENLEQCSLTIPDIYDYLHSLGYKPVYELDRENVHFTYTEP